ncbi:hypothetical protein HanRHA438_Chr07g0291261 [Helianthus annuus]|nr:hypothetical protein HanRHA438_Chr07g0291261 [Helianthus annuus]
MTVIASLSVVAFAAASDAITPSYVWHSQVLLVGTSSSDTIFGSLETIVTRITQAKNQTMRLPVSTKSYLEK